MRIVNKQIFSYLLGIILPMIITVLCLLVGGMPKSKQRMMISLSKSQLIISNVVLACLVILIIYLLIVFARIKSNQGNKSITANRSRTKVSNRQRYFSLAVDDDSRPLVDCNVNSKLSPGSNVDGNIVNIGVNGARASADDHIEDENGEIEEPLNFNDPYQEKAKIYNDENQIMQHISLIIILTFNTLLVRISKICDK
jgi:uncharacterized membrane protein